MHNIKITDKEFDVIMEALNLAGAMDVCNESYEQLYIKLSEIEEKKV